MKITAEIKNYKFVKDEELKRFWRMAIGMVDGDGLVRIEVSKAKRKQRTNSQNSYYWGVVIPHLQMILRDLGNDFKDEELHAYLKQKFLDNRVMTVLGESIEVEPSTADLSTVEFQLFIDRIVYWCASDEGPGVVIPAPGEKISHV